MSRHFIVDTDTASDDAVALVMEMRYPDVHVEAITVVAGNFPVDQGVQNALYTVALCGQSIPVHRGMSAPLSRPLQTAQYVHGDDGMGDIGLPLRGRKPASNDAIRVLNETIRKFSGAITLVTLRPLTNIAAVIKKVILLLPRLSRSASSWGGRERGAAILLPSGKIISHPAIQALWSIGVSCCLLF